MIKWSEINHPHHFLNESLDPCLNLPEKTKGKKLEITRGKRMYGYRLVAE